MMILTSPPATGDYVCVRGVSYTLAKGVEHHGLAITVKSTSRNIDDSSAIFYPPSLRVSERALKMRKDLVALFLRATLDKGIVFVCPDDDLRQDLQDELAWMKCTSRTRTCVLEEL